MTETATEPSIGFTAAEIDTSAPTRAARLKWVLLIDQDLPAGRAVNAAICASAATTAHVSGLLGPAALDRNGSEHPGLPRAGCTVLSATAEQLSTIRAKAAASDNVFVADMPAPAQHTRIYDEYLDQVSVLAPDELTYYAVSLVGPRNRIDRLVGKLSLLP